VTTTEQWDEGYERLVATVVEIRALLDDAGVGHWSRWMARVQAELAAHDAEGFRRLLGAYGGMGSINDLVLTPANGHRVTTQQVPTINHRLRQLVAAAYEDATALLRDLP